uniref:ARAD1C08932p n=1 Tax=Blastobotrys adeninivorans TaxID=409370 RepID=A0A060SZK9_BLAAD
MEKKAAKPWHVIRPAPFADTLAILALFSRLPVIIMSLIHCVFITTIFSSSMASRSHFRWNSLGSGWTASSGHGGVSTMTMVIQTLVIDTVVACITLFLGPARQVVLMFANATVASSLGGGNRVFSNAIYSTTVAEVIRLALTRYIFQGDIVEFDDEYLSAQSMSVGGASGSGPQFHSYEGFNTLTGAVSLISRTARFLKAVDWRRELPFLGYQIIAIHVIGMGLVPFVKRIFPERADHDEDTSSSISSAGINTAEPEYGTTVISFTDADDDIAPERVDFAMLYPPATKRNKRLAAVRANQPLWSTLASSMVLAARQEEHDPGQSSTTGGHSSSSNQSKCFIRFILDNMVVFAMVGFDDTRREAYTVLVNGIQWPQVCIDQEYDYDGGFLIVVYGLTPVTQYELEIQLSGIDSAIMKVNVCTTVKANSNQPAPLVMTSRPLSPVTTLLDTLTTAQMSLSEEKARLKRLRKEHAKRHASLRSEIESVRAKLDMADKGDERNRRKVLSLRESVKQLEQEIEEIITTTEKLSSQQDQGQDTFSEHQQQYQIQMDLVESKFEDHRRAKEEWESKIAPLQSELNSLINKQEKLELKKDRLSGDCRHLDTEVSEMIANEVARRKELRDLKLERRHKLQEEFSDSINKMDHSVEETKRQTTTILQATGSSRM